MYPTPSTGDRKRSSSGGGVVLSTDIHESLKGL